jgi:MFS transporter, FHS family, L-fucose permease
MQINTPASSEAEGQPRAGTALLPWVICLFFAWGLSTVLIDTLVPKLKGLFSLSYTEATLTPFCFFLAYLLVSVPAGWLLARVGYVRGIVVGLAVMILGCLLFTPAAEMGVYAYFLLALFVLASGITMLQVAANPLVAILGPAAGSHSRLNLAQAFNSLGTFIGPLIGAALILKGGLATAADTAGMTPDQLAAYRITEAHAIQGPFWGIAAGLVLLVVLFWRFRQQAAPMHADAPAGISLHLLGRPRLGLGVVSIFLYVGAEVSIGSLMANYLMQPGVLGLDAADAGRRVSLYWGCAMVGRFIGSVVLRHVPAGRVLAACALGGALLACTSALSAGMMAAVTLIAVGLCNSTMFPTIFTLAIEDLGEDTPRGSSLLCVAIVGGAVVPVLTGYAADHVGLAHSLFVPALCYLGIAAYGYLSRSLSNAA